MRAWLTLALLAAGCTSAPRVEPPRELTAAERSGYEATSTYEEVMGFLGSVSQRADGVHLTSFGTSVEGRGLPLAVWGAPAASAEAIRSTGKTRVLVFSNIHAGEVAGKEAALMLVRDLADGRHAAWADSLVVLVAPIYNADGNERIAPGNRGPQLGPIRGMGERPNAMGLDLNRDFAKLMAPESRALVGLLRDVDPHVVVDLHTTNGTHMGYHLTYAPPLSPNTPPALDALLRDEWLPQISAEILRTDSMATDHYGNVPGAFGGGTRGIPRGWYSFSPQARFSTNYTGLRGRIGILSEAYSYAPFDERVHVTKRFVEEILAAAWRDASRVRELTAAADAAPVVGSELAVRASFVAPESTREILMGAVDTLAHPVTGAPMLRRREVRTPETMPVFSRFGPTETVAAPAAYLVPRELAAVLDLLEHHGIRTGGEQPAGRVQRFRVDSTRIARQPFQNVRAQEVFGGWVSDDSASADDVTVPVNQPLGRLVVALLEPRSDDGVLAWAFPGALDTDAERVAIRRVVP